jgi:succinate dehydrogenase / fumarate reductase iron-sulfur subunit
MEFSIYRFDPETNAKPRMQNYTLDINECEGSMLLDALIALKSQDESLSFRRSCGEGVCGSDGMSINGKNGLACITPISSLSQNKVTVLRPLPGMPVIKDLIVDLTNFYEQYRKVKPFLQNTLPEPVKERLQTPEQREKLDGLYECILCGCCSSSCPSYWWNPEKFRGPAALLQAARFIQDNRDSETAERLEALEDAYSLFRCRSIMNCTDVCPKNLNPNKAIGEIIDKMLDKGGA